MARAMAHTGGVGGTGHELIAHLRDTAARTRRFASTARPTDADFAALAAWAGWLHDLGKYRPEFQDYLFGRRAGGPETQHAVFGAGCAASRNLPSAVALAILGHHAGLPSWPHAQGRLRDDKLSPVTTSGPLFELLGRDRQDEADADPWPAQVAEFFAIPRRGAFSVALGHELRVRMLFSCLVDADYLDTEHYMTGRERRPSPLQSEELLGRLDRHVRGMMDRGEPTPVNRARREVYEACLAAAERPRGLYRLTAPTGSGKTLAMMAFALKHAEVHKLRRVIVVLPFLAIIEQNAGVYRDVLRAVGEPDPVVEHHSAARVFSGGTESEPSESESLAASRAKQAAENWDAPVVVTTAVQFLESLFARRPGRCRKLHNIAQSVVVFDEVQTLPFPLLEPILSVVRDLREGYGVSFLLGSATQPRLERSANLPSGLVPGEAADVLDGARSFAALRRASLSLPLLTEPDWSWKHVADRLAGEPRALVIVNLRKHAQDLYDLLKSRGIAGVFHLSSTMCAAHRRAVLGKKDEPASRTIYRALKDGAPCVVVSTQVVEAGVDLDFPIVFRASAPLDAIIQAAGRCDREGDLTLAAGHPAGRVVVFRPDVKYATPPGFYQEATDLARRVFDQYAADPDSLLHDPAIFAAYHAALIDSGYGSGTGQKVQEARRQLDFKTVADLFRLIDDAGQGVIVPYGEAPKLLAAVRRRGYANHEDRRALQPYVVNLFPAWIKALATYLRPVLKEDDDLTEYVGDYDKTGLGIRLGELPPETYGI